MHFYDYEKEILDTCTSHSHLLIMAEGLDIFKIIKTLSSLYDYPDSLCLIINCDDHYDDLFSKEKTYSQMRTISLQKRIENYKIGGVKVCLSQTLISDILNEHIDIKTISVLFVVRAETVKENSLVQFIIYMVSLFSPHTVIKAFSDDPIRIRKNNQYLDTLKQSLYINDVILYPRFHTSIDQELKNESDFIEIRIKMPKWMEETQLYIQNLINGVKNEIKKFHTNKLSYNDFYTQAKSNKTDSLKENTLKNINVTLSKDLENLKKSLELLFSVKWEIFKDFYT